MTRALLGCTLLMFLSVAVCPAPAQEPIPDFTAYEIPPTTFAPTSPAWREYFDVAALLVGLCLASYLAVVKRSRRGLFLLTIASLAWLGFWREGCICSIGSIQNVTLGIFDSGYLVPEVVVAFFALPLVFTLFFGRTFCAAVCPLGAMQELTALRPVKVPTWLEHTLGLLAYVYLGAAVLFAATGAAFVICRYDPFVALFRQSGSLNMLIFGGSVLLVGVFIGRPYCRYACPYGALLGLLSRVSKWHLKIPPEECIQCRLCADVCPYGAIRETTVEQPPPQRVRGRRRLAGLLLLLPVLVVCGGWLGTRLAVPLSRLHPVIRLAERVRLEETGRVEGSTDASDAFRDTGRPVEELYREAMQKTNQFAFTGGTPGRWLRLPRGWLDMPIAQKARAVYAKLCAVGGAGWLGAWLGLVIGVKLIHLSVRRRRIGYRPDRTGCVSCGRCFWYCPEEQARRSEL